VESHTRITMSGLIRQQMLKFPSSSKSLVIMSDIDEIPSRHTIQLLKTCDFGDSIHLQLRNFLYRCVKLLHSQFFTAYHYFQSFEWFLGLSSWRASAHIWNDNSYYRHSKSTERILADAGWHCSYCFRTIDEYIIKMKGFSHADRIGGRVNLLDPGYIQSTICKGRDIFGMLPEAYSVRTCPLMMSLM
jgi:beta-1,4-mannosyl-glycoprotein beta-1,4-N-acetylglucosaminyltransferase